MVLTKSEMSKRFIKIAIPSIITTVINYMVMTVNLIFVGHIETDSAAKLAGVGLGNIFLGMFCRHIICSTNSALETFVSQAYGQGQLRLAGIYLNRGKMIMTAAYLPLVVMLIFSESIFIAVGQDKGVSAYAFTYMLPMIPALFFLGLFDLSKRFLTCL